MKGLQLVGYTADLRFLVVDDPGGGRYRVPVDEDLLTTVREIVDLLPPEDPLGALLAGDGGSATPHPPSREPERAGDDTVRVAITRTAVPGEEAVELAGPDEQDAPEGQDGPAQPPDGGQALEVEVAEGEEAEAGEAEAGEAEAGEAGAAQGELPTEAASGDLSVDGDASAEGEVSAEAETAAGAGLEAGPTPDSPDDGAGGAGEDGPSGEDETSGAPQDAGATSSAPLPAGSPARRPLASRYGRGSGGRGSRLSPRQIQGQLRAGVSPRLVAMRAATGEDWVRRWLPPIVAEQNQVLAAVGAVRLSLPGRGPSRAPLLEAVVENLRAAGEDPDERPPEWRVTRPEGGRTWLLTLHHVRAGRAKRARWRFDPATRALEAANEAGRALGWVGVAPLTASDATAPQPTAPQPTAPSTDETVPPAEQPAPEPPAVAEQPAPEQPAPEPPAVAEEEPARSWEAPRQDAGAAPPTSRQAPPRADESDPVPPPADETAPAPPAGKGVPATPRRRRSSRRR